MWWKMQWVTNTQESLDGDGHRHKYCSTKPDVCDRVDNIREGNRVCITVCIKCLEGVVDSADNNVNSIKTREGKKELVKAVFQFGF